MHEVKLASSLREFVGGAETVSIEAASIRELLRKLVERYPRMQARVNEGIAVSINGEIYRDDRNEKIPAGADVYLLPRIPGG